MLPSQNTPNPSRGVTLRIASSSNPAAIAGAIANIMREYNQCDMQAIGAGAVNQAVKAIAIARGFVASSGMELVCVPAFLDIDINGEERTAIKFIVQNRTNI